jgi:hypothetical protein
MALGCVMGESLDVNELAVWVDEALGPRWLWLWLLFWLFLVVLLMLLVL